MDSFVEQFTPNTGSTLGEYSQKSGIVLLGVLLQAKNSSTGSTPGPALGVVEVTS